MKTETKVGIAVFFALMLLGGLVSVSGDVFWKRSDGYSLHIRFPDARGLGKGSYVFVSGVQAGKVTKLSLSQEGVAVSISLPKHILIPHDSRFVIATGGLLGESEIHIHRGTSPAIFKEDDLANGELPPSFDQILSRVEDDLQEIRSTFRHVNDVLEAPGVKDDLQRTVNNLPVLLEGMKRSAESISAAADSFRSWAGAGKLEITRIGNSVSDVTSLLGETIEENRPPLHATLRNLQQVSKRLDAILTAFDSDDQAGTELRITLSTIGRAAEELEALLAETRQAFSGKGPEEHPVRQLGEVVNRANRVLEDIERFELDGRVSLRQITSDGDDDRLMDLSLTLGRKGSPWSLQTGVEDLGGDEKFNALLGWDWTDWLELRTGIARDDVGGGLNLKMDELTGFPVESSWLWWDNKGGEWKSETLLEIREDWGLLYRHLHLNDDHRDSVGVFYRF